MIPEDFDYAKTYSGMEDAELLEVARDASDLVPAAKLAIEKELNKRRLKPEPVREEDAEGSASAYCPNCNREVDDPLTCGECSSLICRKCGTALQMPEDRKNDEAASQAAG
ncbi:MAG TPA: hypothetical protein VL240_13160 [Candidatus Binatia bacterium]|nr:hypothetical protein [Candidatus Binatia bacterium]